MIYEFHVTVEPVAISRWIEDCKLIGVKPLIIRLSEGDSPEQFMCSAHLSANWEMAMDYRKWLADHFEQKGYKIVRTKVEIPIFSYNQWVDETGGKAQYFETHIKIVDADLEELYRVVRWFNNKQSNAVPINSKPPVAVSHSLLKGHIWVTQRLPRDHGFADLAFDRTVKTLTEDHSSWLSGYESEVVVYDDNPKVDGGWIKTV